MNQSDTISDTLQSLIFPQGPPISEENMEWLARVAEANNMSPISAINALIEIYRIRSFEIAYEILGISKTPH